MIEPKQVYSFEKVLRKSSGLPCLDGAGSVIDVIDSSSLLNEDNVSRLSSVCHLYFPMRVGAVGWKNVQRRMKK